MEAGTLVVKNAERNIVLSDFDFDLIPIDAMQFKLNRICSGGENVKKWPKST
jgi:hypothetical protein